MKNILRTDVDKGEVTNLWSYRYRITFSICLLAYPKLDWKEIQQVMKSFLLPFLGNRIIRHLLVSLY